MKKVLIGIVIVLVGWALAVFIPWRADRNPGTQSPSADERPGEVLKRFYAAQNSGDTAAYFATLKQSWLERMHDRKAEVASNLRKRQHDPVEVQIISDSVDGDIGRVTYHFKGMVDDHRFDTVMQMQVFKENGQWKVGGW
jgi:hypothetical protein